MIKGLIMTDNIIGIEDKIKEIQMVLENPERYVLLDENTKKELFEELNSLIDSLNKELDCIGINN